jgi:hypothetical protein
MFMPAEAFISLEMKGSVKCPSFMVVSSSVSSSRVVLEDVLQDVLNSDETVLRVGSGRCERESAMQFYSPGM